MRQKRSAKDGGRRPKEPQRPHNRHPLLSLLPATKDVVEKIVLPAHLTVKKKKPTKENVQDFPDLERKTSNGLPAQAKIARQRICPQIKVGLRQKFCHGHMKATPEPKRITPELRLEQFPHQSFIKNPDSKGLLCQACHIPLSLIKSHIYQHITLTEKHMTNLEIWRADNDRNVVTDSIRESEMSTRVYGDTLSEETKLFRYDVLHALMVGGIPRSKLFDPFGELRNILESGRKCTLSKTGLESLIPIVCKVENDQIIRDLKDVGPISLIFDGASEVSEVFTIVVRYWADGRTQQRLVTLLWFKKSVNASEQSKVIFNEIVNKLNLDPSRVVACIRDGNSVNTSCIKKLNRMILRTQSPIIDLTCVSHTVCVCAELFNCPTLKTFCEYWSTMVNQSVSARTVFLELAGERSSQK